MRGWQGAAVWILGTATLALASGAASPDLDRALGFLEAEDLRKVPVSVAMRGPPIPAGLAPAVVDVISDEEIRRSGARTLAELLAQRVGIDVSLDRVVPRGLNTAPSFGFPIANHRTLLLIDGRPANDVVFGGFLAGRELPLEHVARVEVIRGPGSALYGSHAMAGVVNVVTKDAADLQGIGAIGELGSFATRRADVFGGLGGPRANGSFFLRYYGSDRTDQVNDNDDQGELFGFVRGTLGPLRVSAEGLSFREELPGRPGGETPDDHVRRERYALQASLDQPIGGLFRLGGRAYVNRYESEFRIAAADPLRTEYDEWRIGEELSLTYTPAAWLTITFGGEARQERASIGEGNCLDDDGDPSLDCDFDRNVWAAFLEDRIVLPADVTLTAGARYDRVSAFGGRLSPRANLLWRATPSTAAKVGYGEAFRSPSFFELRGAQPFGSDLVGSPAEIVIGNPRLRSETVRTVEGEISQGVSRMLNVRLAGFWTRGRNFIAQVSREDLFTVGICPPVGQLADPICSIPPVLPPVLTVDDFRFLNVDRLEVFGLEAAAGGTLRLGGAGELAWGVQYTLQDAVTRFRNPDTGERSEVQTPLAPDHKVNVSFQYRPFSGLSLFWSTRWLDRQRTGVADPPRLASYFDHDANVVYRLTRGIDLSLGVHNLFDLDRAEAAHVPREPRALLGAVAVRYSPPPPPVVPALPAAVPKPEPPPAEPSGTEPSRTGATSTGAPAGEPSPTESGTTVPSPTEPSPAETAVRDAGDRAAAGPPPDGGADEPGEPRPRRAGDATSMPATPTPAVVFGAPVPAAATPTTTPAPTPTPTVDVASRRVRILQSDAAVVVYAMTAAALSADLAARSEVYDLRGDPDRAREIVSGTTTEADLVVAVGSLAASAIEAIGQDVRAIYCAVLSPERHALPGSTLGGVRYEVSPEAQLRTMQRAFPEVKRIGVIYDPKMSGEMVAAAERAAVSQGLRIVKQVASRPEDVNYLFRLLRPDIDLLWLIPDSTVVTPASFEFLALEAAEARLPLVAFAEAFAVGGAVLSLYADPAAIGRQCASLATRVLRGEAPPGTRDPEQVSCVVNRRIGDRLGARIPAGMCREVAGSAPGG